MATGPLVCTACGSRFAAGNDVADHPLCPACSALSPQLPPPPSTGSPEEQTGGAELAATVVRPPNEADGQQTAHYAPARDPDSIGSTRGAAGPNDSREDGRQYVGRFQIRSILGRGAFLVVYRAFDPLLDREVALKCPLFSEEAHEMQERFVREAKSAARLRHPNIVGLFESGHTKTGPYIVSEFVDGTPLSDVLKTRRVGTRVAVDWVRQIASGLHYAHEQGIVHRDIKPANVMVNTDDVPQVMDFGLAKQEGDSAARMTIEGTVLGTPAYMAPEQARGELAIVGPRSDQYSVGVLLYELLSGRTPYVGDAWSIMNQAGDRNAEPPAPRVLNGDTPPDLEACCLKAMSKDGADRYSSLEAFADDLEAWLDGHPLKARPLGPLERLGRWCKRNRAFATLTFSLALVLAIAAIVGPVLAYQFQHLAADNKKQAEDAETARSREAASRLEAERLLVDSLTESGLTAAENGQVTRSLVWFASAEARSENLPARANYNRTRFLSWLATVARPVQGWHAPGHQTRELSWHPSGTHLMTVSDDHQLAIRATRSGTLAKLPATKEVTSACWNSNGELLAIASGSDVTVYRFGTAEILDRWSDPDQPIVSCEFTDNDTLVVCRSEYVRMRDVSSQRFLTSPLTHDDTIQALAVSPGGRHLATLSQGKLRVFRVGTGELAYGPVDAIPDSNIICQPVFASDDRLVATCNRQKIVWCYDLGQQATVWQRAIERAFVLRTSPDRSLIVIADDRTAVMRDVESGEQHGGVIEHKNLIVDVAFHPDGSSVLTSSLDHTARISRVSDGAPTVDSVPHSDALRFGRWSSDGLRFATVEMTKQSVRIWVSPTESVGSYEVKIPASHSFFKLVGDNDQVFATGFDGRREHTGVELRDTGSGLPIGPQLKSAGIMSDASVVPGQSCVVLVGSTRQANLGRAVSQQKMRSPGLVQFRDRASGVELHPDIRTPSTPVAVEASPDGSVVAVLCYEGQLILVSPVTGKVLFESSVAEDTPQATCGFMIRSRLCFSPDSGTLVVWGSDKTIEIRDPTTGAVRFKLSHDELFVHDAVFSPSGEVLATCGSDGAVRLWNCVTGDAAGADLKHAGWVFSADFSADGRLLATACEDHQVRVWDWKTGTMTSPPLQHQDQVFGVCFLPDGTGIATGSRDGTLAVWEHLTGKRLARTLRCDHMVYQVGVSGDGDWLIATGRLSALKGIRLEGWVKTRRRELASADLRLLAEVVAGERLDETGGMTALSSAEWQDRWQAVLSSPGLLGILRSQD